VRALYTFNKQSIPDKCSILYELRPSPRVIYSSDIMKTYKFDTGQKVFVEILKHFSIDEITDAIEISRDKPQSKKTDL